MSRFLAALQLSLSASVAAMPQAGAEGDDDLLGTVASYANPSVKLLAMGSPPSRSVALMPVSVVAAGVPNASVLAAPASAAPVGAAWDMAPAADPLETYDFAEVLQTLGSSVEPLTEELEGDLHRCMTRLDEAMDLMVEGRSREAIAVGTRAVEDALASRDAIVDPLWEAQFYLNAQVADLRARLTDTMPSRSQTTASGLPEETARVLDSMAARIASTEDSFRRNQLVAQYRTIRTLASMKTVTHRLSPEQRRLWLEALRMLEQVSGAHQQLLLGCETLYVQMRGTARQLRDALGLVGATEGLGALLGFGHADRVEGHLKSLQALHERMQAFSAQVQDAMQAGLGELERRAQTIEVPSQDQVSSDMAMADEELQARLNRLGGPRDGRP